MSPQEEELYGGIVDADDFPLNFKEYVQTELYCLKKEDKKYRSSWVFWSRNDGRPEIPPPNYDDCWDFIYRTSRDSTSFNEKIRAVFMHFIRRLCYSGYRWLVQFWAKQEDEEGRSFLTTQHLPFALTCLGFFIDEEKTQGLCEYRMMCKEQICYLDDDSQKQQQQKQELLEGILGRVFRNQCPEFSPNVEYYSPTEYPLRQHAIQCKVGSSFAFPVFEPAGQTCVGVVEIVSSTEDPDIYDFLEMLPDALKVVDLIGSVGHFKQDMNETHQAALKEISKVSKVVLQVHKLRLAQIWVPYGICSSLVDSRASTPLTNLVKIKHHILTDSGDGDSDYDTDNYYYGPENYDAEHFSRFCKFVYSRRERGVVGRAFLSCRLIYCTDVAQLSLDEYILSHYAREYGFSGCFAIRLQNSFTGANAFVLEFFFPKSFKDGGDPWTSLKEILQTMREKCQSLQLFSGAELTEELPIEVIDFQNGGKLHYISPLHELLKNGGMKQMNSSCQQSNDFQYVGPSNINAPRSKEKNTERIPQRKSKKRGVKIAVTREEILQHSGMSLKCAAKKIEVSCSTLKRACRDYGFERWPPRNSSFVDKERIPHLNNDLPCNPDPVSNVYTKPKDQSVMQDANVVTIKAKYGNDITIKFRLSSSSTLVDLKQQVAKRLKQEAGTYDIKYRDPEDGDLILIACDEDLHDYIHTSKSLDNTSIKVEVIFTQQSQMHESTGAHYQEPYEAKQDWKHGAERGKETMEKSGCPSVEILGEKERAQKRVKKSKDVSTKQVLTLREFGTEDAVENRKNSSAINLKVPFLHEFPIAIQPYIREIKNVPLDGNCGFWAISGLLNLGENAAVQVRKDLIVELHSDLAYYSQMWDEYRIKGLTEILSCLELYPREAHWMDMPDMGPLIASTYGVALFYLSKNQCITFLPHRSRSTTKTCKEIALGFVNNNHFVQVFLLPGHPVPPITPYWHKWRVDAAKDWENIYTKRIQRWREVVSPKVITTDVIEL